jgi:lysophospholipase
VISVVHGYGDHGGRYKRLARYFTPLGFTVYAIDLRGHGESPGKRGHIRQFEDYLLDIDAFLTYVRGSALGNPILLLGHSMGALAAVRYVEERETEIAGLALSSPFFGVKMAVPTWKRAAAMHLSRFMPTLTMPSDLNVEWLTHDPEILAETVRDRLVHRDATPRWFTEALKAQEAAVGSTDRIQVPVLLQVAGDDRIADAAVTERFIERLSCPVTVHRYAGLYHEIYNEVERDTVFADLARWIDTITAPAPPAP